MVISRLINCGQSIANVHASLMEKRVRGKHNDMTANTKQLFLESFYVNCHILPPPENLKAYHAGLQSCLRRRRAVFKVHWKSGVGFYCENIGSKIVYDVKAL